VARARCRSIFSSESLQRIKAEGYGRIGLYSWNEPFLNQTPHEYVRIVKGVGLACDISSTLSIRRIKQLEKVLCSGPDEIIVSMSGADQATYERNHGGGNLCYALETSAVCAKLSIVRMRLIKFHYNADAEKPESLKIGHYLDLPETELLLRRHRHSFCRVCTMPRRPAAPEDGARLSAAVQ
jgi:hypothetical protein